MRLALLSRATPRRVKECSTPFGIYEVGTSQESSPNDSVTSCSTPFGIYEVGTRSSDSFSSIALSAQRLSASMRLARFQRSPSVHLVPMCSTPFGIYEVGTSRPNLYLPARSGCSTPFGIYEVGTASVVAWCPSIGGCSTPFGIYEVGTPESSNENQDSRVLNAFRHL